jgi:hypothetical protein
VVGERTPRPEEAAAKSQVTVVSLSERLKKLRLDPTTEIKAARDLREQVRGQHSVYRRDSAGRKACFLGYRPGHEVPAARGRGRHHALEYMIEPWRDTARTDADR